MQRRLGSGGSRSSEEKRMNRTTVITVTLLVTALLSVTTCRLDAGDVEPAKLRDLQQRNWHQWRGPQASGVAPLADPPLHWAEDKNVHWKIEIPGRGTASPIIWEDQVFILTAIKTDRVKEPDALPA